MHHLLGLLLATVVLVGGVGQAAPTAQPQPQPPPPPPNLGTDAEAAEQARARAAEIFGMAAAGDYNALFDRIHPDAQAVVPRTAGIQALEEIYALARPGDTQILGVAIGAWTWPVTGQAYPTAAEVTYRQPFVDQGQERTIQSRMYLAPFEGEWRWFFGADRAYVVEVLGRFAPPPPPTSAPDIDALLRAVTNDLDQFYQDALASTEHRYVTPGVEVVDEGQAAESGCGLAQAGFWAFYCPLDQTVYLDRPFLRDLSERYGQFAAFFVIGHEWAHHVETVIGLERAQRPGRVGEVYSVELELLADCYTGVWAQDADTRGLLSLEGVANGVAFIYQRLGDPEGIDPFDPRAHGTANARTNAFSDGYDDGFLGCELVA